MQKSGLVALEAALAVARLHSFRRAADELGMSPTSLSNAIAGLESGLGVRLFHRTTRSVSLTEAGAQFVARIAPALTEIRGAMDGINVHRQTPMGTLRLNASLGAARMVFAPLIQAYLRRYPDMHVEIVTDGRMVDIAAEGFDAGIRRGDMVPQDMVRIPIGADVAMAVVGAPAHFAQFPAPSSPADLASHPCIRTKFPSGAPSRWEFSRNGETVNLAVSGPLTLDDPGLMREAALAGIGLAYLAEWYVRDDLASGRLMRVLQDWTPSYASLALYYPSGRQMPAGLRAFVDLIQELR
ncbi:MAG: LysR family transcriptional regulator [Massilia sp.]